MFQKKHTVIYLLLLFIYMPSADHLCTAWVISGSVHTVLHTGTRRRRLRSHLPWAGRGDELYATFSLAYIKHNVLLPTVGQVTYWVKVVSVESSETWLKSPDIRRRALGDCVCSLRTTESHRLPPRMLMANSSMSLLQSCSFTAMCPGIPQLSLTNTAQSPSFPLTAVSRLVRLQQLEAGQPTHRGSTGQCRGTATVTGLASLAPQSYQGAISRLQWLQEGEMVCKVSFSGDITPVSSLTGDVGSVCR